MHKDHSIFERGIAQSKIIKLWFFTSEPQRELISKCAPLYFSNGRTDNDESDYYYFWDFGPKEGSNFLALEPSKIIGMELTEDSFSIEEIHRSRRKTGHPALGNHPTGI